MPRSPLRLLALATLVVTSLAGAQLERLPQGSAGEYTGRGAQALASDQFDEAIELFNQALALDKHYYYALYNLAFAHQQVARLSDDPERRREHYTEARRRYAQALQQRPDSAEVLCNLGIIASDLQEYTTAAQHFAQAADQASAPEEIAGYAYNRGTAEEQRGEYRAAEEAYRRCLNLDPDHFGAHFNLGTLYLRRLDQPARAREHLAQARQIDSRRPQPVLNLAVLAEREGRVEEAEQLYAEAVRTAQLHRPHLEAPMRWHRARFYWRTDIPDPERRTKILMKEDLLAILQGDPDFPGANGLLGRYYESIAEYGEAVHYLEREVRQGHFDPESEIDLMSHFLLAIIYSEHLDNTAKALEHVNAYYALRPGDAGDQLRRRALGVGGGQSTEASGEDE